MKIKKNKKIINIILILLITIILEWIVTDMYQENKIKELEENNTTKNISSDNKTENNNIQIKEKIIEEYKGYNVQAKLEIPAIKLETYILSTYTIQSLNISVTKFFGANANEIGNCCIAGHNFNKDNMFKDIKNLKLGDKIYISDNNYGKIEYTIYDLYKVLPDNTSCLSQNTQGKREVTLITCTNDSTQRIIVKAVENI